MKSISIQLQAQFLGHKDAIYALCPTENPNEFFSAGGDGRIVRWNIDHFETGNVLASLPETIYKIRFNPASQILLAGTRFGNLYQFELQSNKLISSQKLNGDIFALIFDRDNNILAGTSEGYIYRLACQTLEIMDVRKISDKSCRALMLRNDILISGWSDGMIRMHQLGSLSIGTEHFAHQPSTFCLWENSLTGDVVSGGRDAHLKIWAIDKPDQFQELQSIPAHNFTVNSICGLAPSHFATGSRDKTIKIWDSSSYSLLKVIDYERYKLHTHSINTLLYLPDYDLLISGGDDKRINAIRISPAELSV